MTAGDPPAAAGRPGAAGDRDGVDAVDDRDGVDAVDRRDGTDAVDRGDVALTGPGGALRIVVYPHSLDIGGSQLNAVELAAAVRDRGHDVSLFAAAEGPLADHAERLGLRLDVSAGWRRRPSPSVMGELTRLAAREAVDVVHAYEWPPCLEVFGGPHLRRGTPMLCTVMSMGISRMIPPSVPLVVGTEQIAVAARGRRGAVTVVEPPVDTVSNHPGFPCSDFGLRVGLDPSLPVATIVSRLATELKQEGIERAVDATGRLAAEGIALQLVIVGDGPARDAITARAGEVNARTGGRRVFLVGEMVDPRPAYATADVVLGMGGSALRAMAFAKPLIVLGERGFSEVLEPATWERFLWTGFFGLGDGGRSAVRLSGQLRDLIADPARREALGEYSRRLVEERFSLTRAAAVQDDVYRRTASAAPPARRRLLAEASAACARVLGSKVAARLPLAGRRVADDCNSIEAMARTAARAGSPAAAVATRAGVEGAG